MRTALRSCVRATALPDSGYCPLPRDSDRDDFGRLDGNVDCMTFALRGATARATAPGLAGMRRALRRREPTSEAGSDGRGGWVWEGGRGNRPSFSWEGA
jgi:hypothetical protein